ncbi:Gfo/Idh/MocA family protein [Komagataeibacter sp. FNDCR2]|uniref:Gfo/Idh/MocA family protein n=1 Tax=Komagataeibacter sp. FNDCR2 TaxID=2878682 RepID=UPI001E5F5B00|nr:Gfo/Idh/MocA family oxidoreductase [Komagataeibacter sp. FNDCR2]MCE2574098.1 Gfo/Idh/MocA family oxidoreductase [Komagataeibacter sp. FNDCR2]
MLSLDLTESGCSSVRWGIVGTGTIATRFAEDIKYVAGARLGGVSSRSLERATRFCAQYGGIAYEEYKSLINDENIDAVYIASPNMSHFQIAWDAIAANKSVLVEKPLVTTSEEAKRLCAFATERKVFLMEGVWTRFLPAIVFVKDALCAGAIGELRRVRGELAFRHAYTPDNRFFDPAKGGGSLLDLGLYLVSLSLFLLGHPDTVHGKWRGAPTGVDMAADIELSFGGIPAFLRCGFDRTGGNLFRIEGSRGSLFLLSPFIGARCVLESGPIVAKFIDMLCMNSVTARVFSKLARKIPIPGIKRYDFDFQGYGLQFEIEAATKAIKSGHMEVSFAPLSESIETIHILEKIRCLPQR